MPNDTAFSALAIEDSQTQEDSVHPLLAQRRSQRAFSSRPVEPETLGTLFEAARWAPSSFNEQPWSFIVTTQRDKPAFDLLLGCLLDYNVRWAQHAPVLVLSVARLTFAASGEPNRHALHDVGQAIANLTFQANSYGLTVCQMAGFDVPKAHHAFSIPPDHEPVTVAAIGYPGDPATLPEKLRQKELTPPQRKPSEDFVFEGRWGGVTARIRKGE